MHPLHIRTVLAAGLLLLGGVAVRGEAPAAGADADLPPGALARFGSARFRTGDSFYGLALSSDGKLVATRGREQNCLLDATTGLELRRFRTDLVAPSILAFSPDGTVLASSGQRGNRIALWDPATGKELRQLATPQNRPASYVFSADSKVLAAGSEGGENNTLVSVWDVSSGRQLGAFTPVHNFAARVALGPDGKYLASWGQYLPRADDDRNLEKERARTIQLWDVSAGKEVCQLKIDAGMVSAAAFSPDGKTLAAASEATTVLWDVATGKEIRRVAARRNLGAHLAFAPDGKLLVSASSNGTAQVWDAATGKRLILSEGPKCRLVSLVFPADGKVLACGTNGKVIYLWNVLDGKVLTPTDGHQDRVTALTFLPGAKSWASLSVDGTIFLWPTAAGKAPSRVTLRDDDPFRYATDHYTSSAFSPDGKYVARGSDSGVSGIRLWELASGKAVCDFDLVRSNGTTALAFSPDSARLAAGGRDNIVRVWDIDTGRELRQLQDQTGEIRCLAFSPDGKTLAVGSSIEVKLWDLETGKGLAQITKSASSLAFSPDGKLLAGPLVNGAIQLCDVATGKELRQFDWNASYLTSPLVFSPDGRTLAAGTLTRDVRARTIENAQSKLTVWEVASGKVRCEFTGHQGAVAVAYAADGRRLASGSSDTTVLVWDLTDGIQKEKTALAAKELEELWSILADFDGPKGRQTILKLAAAPADSVPFLKERLKPAEGQSLEMLRPLRVLEALELIGTPQAREFLEALAKGKSDAPLTQEAEKTLERLKKRTAEGP